MLKRESQLPQAEEENFEDGGEEDMMLPALARRPTRVARTTSARNLGELELQGQQQQGLEGGGLQTPGVGAAPLVVVPEVAVQLYRCLDCGSGPFKRIGLYTHYRSKHLKKKEAVDIEACTLKEGESMGAAPPEGGCRRRRGGGRAAL